jgi:4-hydroxyproline epimerase
MGVLPGGFNRLSPAPPGPARRRPPGPSGRRRGAQKCQILNTAPGRAAAGGKSFRASAAASPEFAPAGNSRVSARDVGRLWQDPPAAAGRATRRDADPPMADGDFTRIRAIDSHTGGEPTRVVIEGGPQLTGSLAERVACLRREHDSFRAAVCTEPRASEVLVGALLTPPLDPRAAAGVIFFNNAGYLGMCGHGTIGVVATLAWLGRLAIGTHLLETPVGVVTAELHASGRVSVQNVPAYRHAKDVGVEVAGHGRVTGDIAWGGNWFFLCADHGRVLETGRVDELVAFAASLREALAAGGITGRNGAEIDHIELTAPAGHAGVDSRNFVLCPGRAWDRSPCGTGTSAKLACLAADGKLAPGVRWRQESIVGSVFEGSYASVDGALLPTITGQAWITADTTLLLDRRDPYCFGFPESRP